MVEAKVDYRTDFLMDETFYNYLKKAFLKDGPFNSIRVARNLSSISEALTILIAEDIENRKYDEFDNWLVNFEAKQKDLTELYEELTKTLPSRLKKFWLEGKIFLSDFQPTDSISLYSENDCKGPWYSLADRV
jgi:hypothetical protein